MKTEVREVTPDVAKEMLTRNQRNRKISEGHVKFLSREMTNGNWKFDGQPIRFNEAGRLLDGQHRLSAIVDSGLPQEFLIVTGIESDAFKVMDTGKNRRAGDVFGIGGIEYSNTVAATTRVIHRHSKGIVGNESAYNKPSISDLYEFYENNPRIMEFVKESQKLYTYFNRVLSVSYIAAYKYLMAEKNVEQSEEFWNKLCTGLGLEKGSPIKVLRDKLIADKISKSSLSRANKDAIIFKAWNSYRKGKTIKLLRWDKEKEKFPELI